MPDPVKLERLELDDGRFVWVQTADVRPAGATLAGDPAAKPGRIDDALEMLRPAVSKVFASLADINRPKTIEMEFGVGFSGKVGVFLASADSEVSFKIKLGWENPVRPQVPEPPAQTPPAQTPPAQTPPTDAPAGEPD
jgi:hypothetical protein